MTKRISVLVKSRREKLEELYRLGVEPYPQTSDRKHSIAKALRMLKKKALVAGRIKSLRSHGKIVFLDVEDETGKMQLFFNSKELGEELSKIIKLFDVGDFIEAKGEVFKTKAGETTIRVSGYKFLTKSLQPLPSSWYGFKDINERCRKRYVDFMMNPESKRLIMMRSKIVSEVRKILESKEFIEVETPTLQTIYGGANARPFTTHYNALKRDFYLKISDELYLKRLIIGGFEKVFEIDHDFRNEGIDATHNPEFTMMECYWAYADYNDMMKLTEEIYSKVAKKLLKTTKV